MKKTLPEWLYLEGVCSYTILVVLAVIELTISIRIGTYFAYKYMNQDNKTGAKKVLIIKQQVLIQVIYGRSQRNKHQKSNILFFQ